MEHIHIFACMYVCMHVSLYICMYPCTHVCMCVYICIWTLIIALLSCLKHQCLVLNVLCKHLSFVHIHLMFLTIPDLLSVIFTIFPYQCLFFFHSTLTAHNYFS